MNIERILEESYSLYMPQVRSEILGLATDINTYIRSLKRPAYIVEIGTKFGGTFNLWCAINNHPQSVNISVDMSDGGLHGGISEYQMECRNEWFRNRYTNCIFLNEDSKKGSALQILRNQGVYIDFLFIDGDHSYEGVKADYEIYYPYVAKYGLIAFHDINESERHISRNVFVSKLWDEISCKYSAWEYNAHEDWAGIGVIVKD